MMIYFIVFGDTTAQLVANFADIDLVTLKKNDEPIPFYTAKWFYILIISGLLLPLVIKKELGELAIISYILFFSIGLFVIMNLGQLLFDPRFVAKSAGKHFWIPTFDIELIQALSITLVAYSYQQNCFPIYSAMKDKNNAAYMKMSKLGLLLTGCIYFAVAVVSICMFGTEI